MTYWHGGGRIEGDYVLNGIAVGTSRSGDTGVHVTTERSLAETYASTIPDRTAWVYEVEPIGELVPVPSLVGGPTISFRCERARIVRRFTVSRATRDAVRSVMGVA